MVLVILTCRPRSIPVSWVSSMGEIPECWLIKQVMDHSLLSCINTDLHPLVIKGENYSSSSQAGDQIDPRVVG